MKTGILGQFSSNFFLILSTRTKIAFRCACDIAAHAYTWSFEPNQDWSSVYAGSEEIHGYFKNIAAKYDLEKYIKYNHRVSKAEWNNIQGHWEVQATDTNGTVINDSCHILVSAPGLLNSWKWPKIEGLHDYKGILLHTAAWDPSVDLNGKHVGLIGNGYVVRQILFYFGRPCS